MLGISPTALALAKIESFWNWKLKGSYQSCMQLWQEIEKTFDIGWSVLNIGNANYNKSQGWGKFSCEIAQKWLFKYFLIYFFYFFTDQDYIFKFYDWFLKVRKDLLCSIFKKSTDFLFYTYCKSAKKNILQTPTFF